MTWRWLFLTSGLAVAASGVGCGAASPALPVAALDAGPDAVSGTADVAAPDVAMADGVSADLAAPDRAPDRAAAASPDAGMPDISISVPPDARADGSTAGPEAAPPGAVCPAGVPPRDVCGCGCCGGQPMGGACYYPARGETAAAIPDPRPPNCAMVGCSFGVRHVCCADPGPSPVPRNVSYCAYDLATGLPRFAVVATEGNVCIRVTMVWYQGGRGPFPTTSTTGWHVGSGERFPCDLPNSKVGMVGALGAVDLPQMGANSRASIHLAAFFDAGTGVATATRLDVDDLVVGGTPCPR